MDACEAGEEGAREPKDVLTSRRRSQSGIHPSWYVRGLLGRICRSLVLNSLSLIPLEIRLI